jgi:hypothetical protein
MLERRMGARLAAVCALAMIGAACGEEPVEQFPDVGDGEAPPPPLELRVLIGVAGGTIEGAADGPLAGVSLTIPAGALAQETEIVVRGTVDPVPLSNRAERVGPQIALEPAGLELAVPAQITIPYDSSLRAQWDTPDAECKVWQRSGDGWMMIEQLSTTSDAITIALSTLSTVAAGVSVRDLAPSCTVLGTCAPTVTCLEPNALCLTPLASLPSAPFNTSSLNVANSFLYYVRSPAADTFTITELNLLDGTSRDYRSLVSPPNGAVSTLGHVEVGVNGDAWIGLAGSGNVRFRPASAAARLDTIPGASPAGVVVDQSNLTRVVRVTQGSPDGGLTLGRPPNSITGFEIVTVPFGERFFPISRIFESGVSSSTRPAFAFASSTVGIGFFHGGRATNTSDPCGSSRTLFIESSQSGTWAGCAEGVVHRTERPVFGSPTVFDLDVTISSMATDDDGNLYVVDASRAELIIVMNIATPEGGRLEVQRHPLTTAQVGTEGYLRMLPRAIRFDEFQQSMVLVTRGSSATGRADVFLIDAPQSIFRPG